MGTPSKWKGHFVYVIAAVIVLASPWTGEVPHAYAWDDEDCRACHTDESIVKEGGAYLYVDPEKYDRTSHADVGCTSCHDSVSEDHPEDRVRPSRAKCGECHDDVEAEYAQSPHAGNASCTDCHDPHDVQAVTEMSGTEMNQICMNCHEEQDVVETHGVWLPQTTLHIQALPCIACHTGSEDYVITFYVEMTEEQGRASPLVKLATYGDLMKIANGKDTVTSVIDTNADGQVSTEELRTFYRKVRPEGVRLWGMMMPEVATHNYTTLDNRWDCSFCHASGPGKVQSSFVALPNPTGSFTRLPLEAGAVQNVLYGTADFYMIGASRSRTLSLLGIVIILGGLALPLVHGTLRLLSMRHRREH